MPPAARGDVCRILRSPLGVFCGTFRRSPWLYAPSGASGAYNLLMPTFDRITVNPRQMNGQPCVRGMRLTVRRVVEAVATYPNREDLQREYPELEDEDIRQALLYAAVNLPDGLIPLDAA